MERYICEECQDIVFISVRPPGLNNDPVTGEWLISQYLGLSKH